jgi:hypothetical protein
VGVVVRCVERGLQSILRFPEETMIDLSVEILRVLDVILLAVFRELEDSGVSKRISGLCVEGQS